jgi:hypothetical protein
MYGAALQYFSIIYGGLGVRVRVRVRIQPVRSGMLRNINMLFDQHAW